MNLFFPVERATLLIPSGTESDPDRKHLFILLNNPITDEKLILLVSLSSIKQGHYHDPACIIDANETEHEFIKKPLGLCLKCFHVWICIITFLILNNFDFLFFINLKFIFALSLSYGILVKEYY